MEDVNIKDNTIKHTENNSATQWGFLPKEVHQKIFDLVLMHEDPGWMTSGKYPKDFLNLALASKQSLAELGELVKKLDFRYQYTGKVTDEKLSIILKQYPNVREVALLGSNITDEIIVKIGGLKYLSSLELIEFEIANDKILEILSRFPALKCSLWKATDAKLGRFSKLTNLTELDLGPWSNLRNTGFTHLSNFTNLSRLDLSYAMKLTDIKFVQKLTRLTFLSLQSCENVGDFKPLSNLVNLDFLDLSKCLNVEDSDLTHLSGLTNLTSIDLSYCAGITNDVFLSKLTSLNLKNYKK